MRRTLLPCLALAALVAGQGGPAEAAEGDLAGVWFAEYGTADGDLVQEVSQRLEDGRWRAEIRVFEDCRETQRFMVEGVWSAGGQVLTQTIRRRGHFFVSPRAVTYDVLDLTEDRLRLGGEDGGGARTVIEAQRVPRNFRPPAPECTPPRRAG
jgi:hypothetical protein